MITAQVEEISEELFSEALPLLDKHYGELSEHKAERIALNPQYDVYYARARAGQTLCITLRENAVLVGYLMSFIAPGLHYKSCLTATTDIFYVKPDKRGGELGVMLFEAWKRECGRRGVRLMQVGLKLKHEKHARKLLEAVGFGETEVMFWRFLDKDKL